MPHHQIIQTDFAAFFGNFICCFIKWTNYEYMHKSLSEIDSLVMFQNTQGTNGRGTLMHITRTSAVFEVYNPYSIVQLSEVLPNLHILRGEREIYKGRAVVSHILTTGIMLIVTVSLVDTWSDLDGLRPGGALKVETERFIQDWTEGYKIFPKYQLIVSNIRNFLAELSRWLEEAEVEAGISPAPQPSGSLMDDFYHEVKSPITPKFNELFCQFEEEASNIPLDDAMTHKAFARRALHPFILCSPFAHRAYTKPLGFAGDYEIVKMMLLQQDNKPSSIYARIVDDFHINASTPEAHRNRIKMVQERLSNESGRVIHEEERMFTVMNVGCGPAVEVQNFIRDNPLSNQSSFQLMDFNMETIEHLENKIGEIVKNGNNKPIIKFINKSIDELLQETTQKTNILDHTFDMVYCAGLFDYFSDQICKRLVALFYSWLREGGLVTVTNVHPCNPVRYQMEYILEWNMVYRNEADMKLLAPKGTNASISKDGTGVNVFLDIRKQYQ